MIALEHNKNTRMTARVMSIFIMSWFENGVESKWLGVEMATEVIRNFANRVFDIVRRLPLAVCMCITTHSVCVSWFSNSQCVSQLTVCVLV